MAGPSFLVLPSPALPDSAYAPLAEALRRQGVDADVAPASLARAEGAGDLIGRWGRLAGGRTVLLPHSNAGNLAPSVRAAGAREQAIVFVDAALPPVSGTTTLAPAGFRALLGELADEDGTLPPWTRWWPRADLATVVPDDLIAALDADCPRLPLRYFDSSLTVPDGWASEPNAYLAFGDTYEEEWTSAGVHAWPRLRMDGGHLHFLRDPEAVASRVLGLAAELGA